MLKFHIKCKEIMQPKRLTNAISCIFHFRRHKGPQYKKFSYSTTSLMAPQERRFYPHPVNLFHFPPSLTLFIMRTLN